MNIYMFIREQWHDSRGMALHLKSSVVLKINPYLYQAECEKSIQIDVTGDFVGSVAMEGKAECEKERSNKAASSL